MASELSSCGYAHGNSQAGESRKVKTIAVA